MEHSFNIKIAEKYGIASAVLLKNIYFWIEKNRANETNFYDGYYWTYNSKKAFADLFPYLTPRQIDYALQKLIDDGLIITGNYNKVAYDRTLWYAITKKGYSILQNCEMDTTNSANGINDSVEPIPDNKPVINKNIKTDIKKESKSKVNSFDSLIEEYANGNEKIKTLLIDWLKVRKAKRAAMTDRAIQLNLQKLDRLAAESGMFVTDYLKEVICRGWQAFYPIKNYGQPQKQGGGILEDHKRIEKLLEGDIFN